MKVIAARHKIGNERNGHYVISRLRRPLPERLGGTIVEQLADLFEAE